MSIELAPSRTAVVLIDLQHGILGNALSPHAAEKVVGHAVELARACAQAGGLVVPVNVAFAPDLADRLRQPVDSPPPTPAGGWPANWSELHPRIAELPAKVRITKRQWSAFHGTELDLQLRRRGITTVVLAGVATNFGVESTARDAWQNAYDVVIAEDACSTATPELHGFAIQKILPRIARIRPTADLVAALSRRT